MKRFIWYLTVFGIPTFVFIGIDLVLNSSNNASEIPWIAYAFFIPINVFIISIPQWLWAIINLSGGISKQTYLGGLIAAHLWLIIFAIYLVINAKKSGDGDSIVWLLYFPTCFVFLAIGASIGHFTKRISAPTQS